jgi:hypothetical protein
MVITVAKRAIDRLMRKRRNALPFWHGTCSLDHWSAEEAANCRRTD